MSRADKILRSSSSAQTRWVTPRLDGEFSEMLICDQNTADLMDWAAEHARARGASWWKSFTTGKSAEMLGGIPHDTCTFPFSQTCTNNG
jgi:hypothetical protein